MRLEWDKNTERLYETGVKNGVLYVQDSAGEYPKGVAWNGLTAVTESPDGAEPTDLWADDMKYLSIRSAETFGGTIEAYMYPDEFNQCDGNFEVVPGVVIGQQNRKPFGFCYRTVLGNDAQLNDYAYKLHLVYNATVSPSEKGYETINDSPDAITFSWEFDTTPVATGIENTKPVSIITVNSASVDAAKLKALEDILYGESGDARLPLPSEVFTLLGYTGTSNSSSGSGSGSSGGGTTPTTP